MRESKIESAVVAWAKVHAILAVKFTPDGEAGWPDRVFLRAGRVLFIEFKAAGKAERPLQAYRIQQLRSQGFTCEVIDNVQSGIQALRSALLPGDGD